MRGRDRIVRETGDAELTIEQAETLAQRTLAMIDANEAVIRKAAKAVVTDRHDADRARVAADLEGLRRAHRPPGRGLEEPDLHWLRTNFSDGLIRTAALYGVRP
jgi:hypothetical protein